jgi:hypothetical protein
MKYLIIISFLILASCSPAWHLNRAIKKDPSIITTHTDTIVKTISDSGKVSFYGDTLIEDSFIVISVKHKENKIDLNWYLKSVRVEFPSEVTNIIPQPTNFTTWQVNKTSRVKIRQENKSERKYLKENTKQIKSDNKVKKTELRTKAKIEVKKLNRFRLFFLGLIVGLILSQTPKFIKLWIR